MTPSERIERLQEVSYTDREADFLCMAALHSGYFLRRQYAAYLGGHSGGSDERFLQKARALGHVSPFSSANRTLLYHLGTRPFYRLIGQENNRNRRTRSPESIKQRLMGLDFVLQHRDHEYLATEEEKTDYFLGRRHIRREKLPTKVYVSPEAGRMTERYFVDKYPLFITPSVVHFCYIDAGFDRGARFETYLRQYGPLFEAVGAFELIYVAENDGFFDAAERVFRRLFRVANPAGAVSREHLLRYFEARRDLEQEHYERFDQRRLDQLRDDRDHLSAEGYEQLYRSWLQKGAEALLSPLVAPTRNTAVHFAGFRLPHHYGLFGQWPGVRATKRVALPAEKMENAYSPEVSLRTERAGRPEVLPSATTIGTGTVNAEGERKRGAGGSDPGFGRPVPPKTADRSSLIGKESLPPAPRLLPTSFVPVHAPENAPTKH